MHGIRPAYQISSGSSGESTHVLQGIVETHEDRARDRERNRLANDYEEMDNRKTDRHWNEKSREEMTERDWRIFREDFSISYKGNTGGTLPLRNWEEAGFPESIMKVCTPFTRLGRGVIAHATCCRCSTALQEVKWESDWRLTLTCLVRATMAIQSAPLHHAWHHDWKMSPSS